jgi:hypothetical protein
MTPSLVSDPVFQCIDGHVFEEQYSTDLNAGPEMQISLSKYETSSQGSSLTVTFNFLRLFDFFSFVLCGAGDSYRLDVLNSIPGRGRDFFCSPQRLDRL